jgi:L,D-peptidoglycan transpeptidase YkuD (ErfK/YbiS/YcfS/YnhG family)
MPVSTLPLAFGITIMLMTILFPHPTSSADAGSSEAPFVLEALTVRNTSQIGESRQLIFATNTEASSSVVTIRLLEKDRHHWMLVSPAFCATIGKKGFAPADGKREGDGKSPTGIFPLGTAFGYAASAPTRMPYRQATDNDFWVDDVGSDDYNRWVSGRSGTASVEKLRRDDDLFKYGIVIEYNMNPVVKGRGSAIFLHVWRGEGKATLGCVAMPEGRILRLLEWLDPGKRPLIVMGTERALRSLASR